MRKPAIFRAHGLPVLQNRTFATPGEARAAATGDVVLAQDSRTGLVQNVAFDPTRLVYDRNYQNEQACSPAFRRHLDEVAAIIERHGTGGQLIEIGCGKGFFLEHLRERGHRITGMDPAYEGDDPDIRREFFTRDTGVSGDGIVLRHVLEHIPNPWTFLADIAAANGGRGTIYLEVPCFDWILRRRAWFDVFYEHVNYFRLDDFRRIFGRVHEAGHVFGGQYLFVVADLASVRPASAENAVEVKVPDDFLAGIDRAAAHARERVAARHVIWGAASKGVIFALYLQRAGVSFDAAIDINPAKQGRYLGVSGLPVVAPDGLIDGLTANDTIYVMNSNYYDEIVAATSNRFAYVTVDDERI
jgi:hypothetical protein